MPSLVIATFNVKKGVEMERILKESLPSWTFATLADFPNATEPEESGATYEENAIIKAECAAGVTGELCLADDAGLEIDAMPGELGLRSKRFAGESTPFSEKIRLVLQHLEGVPEEKRSARFRCCVALAKTGTATETFEDTCEGRIAMQPRGEHGFGYDPIFFLPGLQKTMAELPPEEKEKISHRGKVLRAVTSRLCL